MKNYGLLLKSERKAQGLTQEQAAELAGISVDSWYSYEAGKALPSEETAISICDALGADWLLREYLGCRYAAVGLWGDRIAPESLEQASLSWAAALHQAAQELPRLIQIVADGQVDLTEQADYNGMRPTCLRLAELGLWMAYPRVRKKRKPPGCWHIQAAGFQTEVKERLQNYFITSVCERQHQICRGRGCFPVTGWTFAFTLLGVATATAQLFRIIDVIDGPAKKH